MPAAPMFCLLCVDLWEDGTNCQLPPHYHCYKGYVISLSLAPYECLGILNVGRFASEATTDSVLLITTSCHLTWPHFQSGGHLFPLSTEHKLICTFRLLHRCSTPVIFCIGRLLWSFGICHFFLLEPVTKNSIPIAQGYDLMFILLWVTGHDLLFILCNFWE